jgi:hypothetical protein
MPVMVTTPADDDTAGAAQVVFVAFAVRFFVLPSE